MNKALKLEHTHAEESSNGVIDLKNSSRTKNRSLGLRLEDHWS